jgi:hypothetical protein
MYSSIPKLFSFAEKHGVEAVSSSASKTFDLYGYPVTGTG